MIVQLNTLVSGRPFNNQFDLLVHGLLQLANDSVENIELSRLTGQGRSYKQNELGRNDIQAI